MAVPSRTLTNPRTRRTADERREDVLAAAIVEFATFGYHGGSTERIAAAAGISQPYVLRLFGSKKALFLATLERVCDRIMQVWRDALTARERQPDASLLTPQDRLYTLGIAFGTLVAEVNDLRLVLQAFSSAEDDTIRETSHRRLKEMFDWTWGATGAPVDAIRQHFAFGMMLMVAASIRAGDDVPTEPWARAFLMVEMAADGSIAKHDLGTYEPYAGARLANCTTPNR